MNKILFSAFALVVLSFLLGIYFFPLMPESFASHWNLYGQVDGFMPKFWGLFLMPLISIALFLLFLLIPKIDPLKANIAEFRKYYDFFVLLLILFLFYLHVLTIAWNSGFEFGFISFLAPAFGVLFYYCGILMENAKRNWFIGIRTPWTLSSEKVWDKTNKLGGKLFKAAGIISFFGFLFASEFALFLIVGPVILMSIFVFVYSYFEYKKEVVMP